MYSIWGPASRKWVGSRLDHTSGGSTTCASRSTIHGILSTVDSSTVVIRYIISNRAGSSSRPRPASQAPPLGLRVSAAPLGANEQFLIAAHGAGVERDGALLVHGPAPVPLECLFECDLSFHAGQ